MAKATRQQAEYTVTLELSRAEAMVLRGLLYFAVAGLDGGPRGLLDQISDALGTAGVQKAYDVLYEGTVTVSEGKV